MLCPSMLHDLFLFRHRDTLVGGGYRRFQNGLDDDAGNPVLAGVISERSVSRNLENFPHALDVACIRCSLPVPIVKTSCNNIWCRLVYLLREATRLSLVKGLVACTLLALVGTEARWCMIRNTWCTLCSSPKTPHCIWELVYSRASLSLETSLHQYIIKNRSSKY